MYTYFEAFYILSISAAWVGSFIYLASGFLAFGFRDWLAVDFVVFDSNRKVGGIRFIRLGRLSFSYSIRKG